MITALTTNIDFDYEAVSADGKRERIMLWAVWIQPSPLNPSSGVQTIKPVVLRAGELVVLMNAKVESNEQNRDSTD